MGRKHGHHGHSKGHAHHGRGAGRLHSRGHNKRAGRRRFGHHFSRFAMRRHRRRRIAHHGSTFNSRLRCVPDEVVQDERIRALLYRTACRTRWLNGAGIIDSTTGEPKNGLQAYYPSLTRTELVEILTKMRTSTSLGDAPSEDELEFVAHLCISNAAFFEEEKEQGVPLEKIERACCSYHVMRSRPSDYVSGRLGPFFEEVYLDGRGKIDDDDLFIVMNDLIGNLSMPVVTGVSVVDLTAPEEFDEETGEGDVLPSYEEAMPGDLPNYKMATGDEKCHQGNDQAGNSNPLGLQEGAVVVAEPAMLEHDCVSIDDLQRLKRMAGFSEEDRLVSFRSLIIALNYFSVEYDEEAYLELVKESNANPKPELGDIVAGACNALFCVVS